LACLAPHASDLFVQTAPAGGFSFDRAGLTGGKNPKRFGIRNHMAENRKKPVDSAAVCGNTKAV
jgi:hypothetical protein